MPIFEITDCLSTQLQGKTVSTGHGVQLVRQAIEELNKLRSEEKFAELWDDAEPWRCSINADPPKLPRQVGAPIQFQSSQLHKFATPKDLYRVKYFEILDTAIGCLNFRITNKAVPVMIATENLLRQGWEGSTIDEEDIKTVCMQYPDLDRVRLAAQLMGLDNLRQSCQENTSSMSPTAFSTENIISVSAIGNSAVECMIPEVVSLLKFYLVCPVSSASAERSFSQLHRLKSYLRSTMSQKRLNSLLVSSMYTDELDQLDMQLLLEDFVLPSTYFCTV